MNTFKEKIISSPTSRNRTIDVFEGITTTVTVNKDNSGGMELCSDGLSIAGDNHHRLTQKMLGHLGPLVNKYSKDVLDIGFGAGETAACLAKHKLNKIECIEIAPELVKMAYKYFSHINMGENIEKLVDIKYMDGKNYLHLTPKKYDVIINDVNLPSYSGSAPLFTIENFTNGRNHLKEHGIFITKLHLQDISTEAFNSITGTFLDVFPFVTIWYPSTQPYIFFYLIGSNQKQFFSPSYIKNQLADEEVRESLTMLNMKTNLDVLSCYIGDEKDIRRYIRNYVKNSDSYPYLEFSLDRSKIETTKLFHEFIDSVRQNSIYDHIDWSGYSQEEITTTKLELKTIWQLASYTLKTTFNDNNLEQLLYISKGLKINPKQLYLTNLKLQVIKQIQKEITRRPEQNEMLLNNIENVLLEYPDASLIWLVKAFVFINKKDLNHAYEATLTSIKNDGLCPENQFLMGQILVGQNKPKESVVYFEHVTKLSPDNEFYRCKLGIVYVMNKRINDAFKQFDRVVQQNPNNADAQYYLGETCLLMKNKELAIKKFKKVLELQPNNPKAIKRLNSLIKENGF
jgi:spermidine synthase